MRKNEGAFVTIRSNSFVMKSNPIMSSKYSICTECIFLPSEEKKHTSSFNDLSFGSSIITYRFIKSANGPPNFAMAVWKFARVMPSSRNPFVAKNSLNSYGLSPRLSTSSWKINSIMKKKNKLKYLWGKIRLLIYVFSHIIHKSID